jgi:hypothetical protein
VAGDELFQELGEDLLGDPAVTRSTMMGVPCLRHNGRFFAGFERRSQALLVKLPRQRIAELIESGHGEPFAPAGRVFREWVAVPRPDRRRWRALLDEAKAFADGGGSLSSRS